MTIGEAYQAYERQSGAAHCEHPFEAGWAAALAENDTENANLKAKLAALEELLDEVLVALDGWDADGLTSEAYDRTMGVYARLRDWKLAKDAALGGHREADAAAQRSRGPEAS